MVGYNLKDVRGYIVKLRLAEFLPKIRKEINKLFVETLEAVAKENGFENIKEAAGKIPLETKLGDKSLASFRKLKEFIKKEEMKHRPN